MDSVNKKRHCTWMADLPEHISRVPLNCLAIPGSHDSFSFYLDPQSGVAVDSSGFLKALCRCCPVGRSVVKKWSVCQHENFFQQLESGIRYFDLRVCVKPGTTDFCFLHGLYSHKVIESMRKIREFLVNHEKEVVILDFNHFYNMNQVSHCRLLNMLKDVFGDLLVIPCDKWEAGRATLQNLWTTPFRVYIFYHNDAIHQTGGFWPGYKIPTPWPNTNDIIELLAFQDNIYYKSGRRPDDNFYVWQFVLTPKTSDFVLHLCGSLENTMVAPTEPAVVEWLHGKVAGPSKLNICIANFVEMDNFVPTVIEINYKSYRENRDGSLPTQQNLLVKHC